DGSAVPEVVRVAGSGVAGLAEAAFGALESMGAAAREALPVVREGLNGPHKGAAAAALWAIEPDVSLALPVLLDELTRTRTPALTAHRLSLLGPAAHPALPPLRQLTESPDAGERVAAACAIAAVTGEIESSLHTVLRSAWETHPHTRVHIATTLTNTPSPPLLDLPAAELARPRRHTTVLGGHGIARDEELLRLCRGLTRHLW
ncbi:HEAT repeat domain-containing protein, partial [Streptomyces sp. S6]